MANSMVLGRKRNHLSASADDECSGAGKGKEPNPYEKDELLEVAGAKLM